MVYKYAKNSTGEYVCNICGETRKKQNTMHYHIKSHEDHLPYKCNHCLMEFKAKYSLEIHTKTQHNAVEEKLYRCPQEGCRFKGSITKSNLIIHFIRIHCKSDVERIRDGLICTVCNKESKSLTAFHYHVGSCIIIDDPIRMKQFQNII